MALYRRFASAAGIEEESEEYSLGLYLLFAAIYDGTVVTEHSLLQLVCSSIYLSMRMMRKEKKWPTYLQ